MSRSSSAVERGSGRMSGGGLPSGAPTSAGAPGGDRLRVVEGSDHSPQDVTLPIGGVRLALVTASGFEVPLVTSPAQTARLVRSSGEADAANRRAGGDAAAPMSRRARRPRPVPVDQLLSRNRLVIQVETSLGDGSA